MSSDNSESLENICVVCFKNVEIYSIGSCDHMVCYECSTRMRVLCRQNECPICRQELPRVVFTYSIRPFSEIQNCSPLEDKKFKICFQNRKVQESFYKLLEHCCSVCPNSLSFKTFQNLNDHMKKEHDLYYCNLCVKHLKIFTSERQCYTLKNLDQHKKKGDADDKSHRGHPLCQFCDTRFMDNDCLYRHLRRDHLFCHFCDADGFDLYYSSYDYLLEHFRTEHFLCEEGSCVDEKFTPVFRTDIDLKAHRASAHGKTLGKAATKQARTLELEFTLKPRPKQPESSRRRRSGPADASSSEGAVGGLEEQTTPRQILPKLDPSEFPSLPPGPGSSPVILPQQHGRFGSLTIHAVGRRNAPLAINDENFPMLGVCNDSSAPGTSVRLNINQDRNGRINSGKPRNVSIHVNHRVNGEKNIRIRQDDFPALNSDKTVQPDLTTPKWTCISNKKPSTSSASASTSKTSKKPSLDNDFPSLNSKFSTNLNFKVNEPSKPNFVNIKSLKENKTEVQKTKKASTLKIPVENTWTETSESLVGTVKTKSKKKKSKGATVEETSDTAKKKQDNLEIDFQNEVKKDTSQFKSALNVATPNETTQTKPLPKVEDWFGELKRKGNKNGDAFKKSNIKKVDISSNFAEGDSKKISNVVEPECDEYEHKINCENGQKSAVAKKLDSKAPPGFGNLQVHSNVKDVKKPPPGFSADFPRSNGLTFTNSSGQSYAISANFVYTPPVDFEKRNQNLISKVNKIILNDTSLEQFRKMSILFRQGMLSANDYYEFCVKAMGEEGLLDVFPELLVLLPDISKQQELLQVSSISKIFLKENISLHTCSTCRQVLCNNDVKQHSAQHSIQNNFPALMADQWT